MGLAIAEELGDLRGIAVSNGALGTLALRQNDLPEAERRYREALTIFQRRGEPASEAIDWHQLGMVYQQAHQWDAAERAYRESACIDESLGNLVGASANWNNLAVLTKSAGKPADAENWYHKALAVLKAIGDQLGASRVLSNLADLLRNESSRLTEARQLAEQALAIKQTLDPTAADSAQRSALEAELEEWAEAGLGKLVAALRRLLDGERDEEALGEGLDRKDWLIVHAILRELAEPGSLEALLAGPPQER